MPDARRLIGRQVKRKQWPSRPATISLRRLPFRAVYIYFTSACGQVPPSASRQTLLSSYRTIMPKFIVTLPNSTPAVWGSHTWENCHQECTVIARELVRASPVPLSTTVFQHTAVENDDYEISGIDRYKGQSSPAQDSAGGEQVAKRRRDMLAPSYADREKQQPAQVRRRHPAALRGHSM